MTQLALIDTTLTHGQLAVWNGRLRTSDILPYLKQMDAAGFEAIDILSPSLFEYCVRELGENPFDRLRQAAARVENTALNVWTRGRFLFAEKPLPDDVVAEGIAAIAAAGAGHLTCYDPLNDVASLTPTIEAAHDRDLTVTGAIVYGLSPNLDITAMVELAGSLKAQGVDSVCIFDPSGMLHPAAARGLLPVLVETLGQVPLELSTHCRSGRAETSVLEALSFGVGVIHTASPPIAGGPSVPSATYLADHAARDGISCAVSRQALDEMADYFGALREMHDWPQAEHALPDLFADRHQMPLSQAFWLAGALREAAMTERTAEVLEEMEPVRKDAGRVLMSPPVARAVASQAIANVAAKSRYDTMDPRFLKLVRGELGPLPEPADEGLSERTADMRGDVSEPMTRSALEALTPDSDGLVIAACCGLEALHGVRAAKSDDIANIATPRDLLERELTGIAKLKSLRVEKGSEHFYWHAKGVS